MGYVLVLLWVGLQPAIATAEFNSWDACQKAGKLAQQLDDRVRFVCSEKGEKASSKP